MTMSMPPSASTAPAAIARAPASVLTSPVMNVAAAGVVSVGGAGGGDDLGAGVEQALDDRGADAAAAAGDERALALEVARGDQVWGV